MACRCVYRIYHPRSRSSEVCSLDKPLASLGVYLGCKLPLTSTSGGIFGIHTSKPWFIYYLFFGIIILAGTVYISYLQFNSSSTRADQATENLKNVYVGIALLYSISYNPWTGLCYKKYIKIGRCLYIEYSFIIMDVRALLHYFCLLLLACC